jgi:hypothetical protein
MTDHGRAHLFRRIDGFTRLTDLAAWWKNNASLDAKTDDAVVAKKELRKAQLT